MGSLYACYYNEEPKVWLVCGKLEVQHHFH